MHTNSNYLTTKIYHNRCKIKFLVNKTSKKNLINNIIRWYDGQKVTLEIIIIIMFNDLGDKTYHYII